MQLATGTWLMAIVAALGRGLPARWAERAGAASLVAMTVAVCIFRGAFLPALLLWNAIIPLGVATSGRRVRRELAAWTAAGVAATLACYVATRGSTTTVPSPHLNPLLSLTAFLLVLFGIVWMYVRDREGLRASHRELERQRRVGARMESVGRLAGGVAHDFNNLLTIISTHTQLLQARPADEGTSAGLASIAAATDRARQLTLQLLAFGGRDARVPVALYPTDTLRSTLDLLERTLPENIRLKSDFASDGWAVLADPMDIENAVLNVVLNARDAMPEGGELEVGCRNAVVDRRRKPGDPDVRPGRYVRIDVRDSGRGMSPQLMDQIFDPFFTTKDASDGSGLGLTSAYTAVRKLGGDLSVRSHLGRGSCFSIYLPVSDESAEVLRRSRSTSAASSEPMTVLLVEDEPQVRTATGLLLRARGYDLIVAEDGARALRAFAEHRDRIDVVLTDFMMSGMSGVELGRRIRAVDSSVGFVLMSGYAEDAEIEGFLREHRAHFIRKPFSTDDVTHAIARATRRGVEENDVA